MQALLQGRDKLGRSFQLTLEGPDERTILVAVIITCGCCPGEVVDQTGRRLCGKIPADMVRMFFRSKLGLEDPAEYMFRTNRDPLVACMRSVCPGDFEERDLCPTHADRLEHAMHHQHPNGDACRVFLQRSHMVATAEAVANLANEQIKAMMQAGIIPKDADVDVHVIPIEQQEKHGGRFGGHNVDES